MGFLVVVTSFQGQGDPMQLICIRMFYRAAKVVFFFNQSLGIAMKCAHSRWQDDFYLARDGFI
jgi:hypothetical protein